MAEYFRDEGQDVLFFVDNIFRFVQAGSEVSALLGRMPSAVGYQPTLATEMGQLQERITSTRVGSVTSVQAIYVPADDLTDPAPANTFAHLDAFIVLSRGISEKGIYPAIDPLDSNSRALQPRRRRRRSTTRRRRASRRCSSATRTCRTSSPSSAWTSSPTRTSSSSSAPARSSASSRSRCSSPSRSPGRPGAYVKLEDTVKGFAEILDGKHDDLARAGLLHGRHDRGGRRRRPRGRAGSRVDGPSSRSRSSRRTAPPSRARPRC